MKTVKMILGITWALAALLIVLATFFGNDLFSRKLVATTGITVSPWFSGGPVIKTVDRDGYTILIHRPVFDALIGERKSGFVQVDWKPDSVVAWFLVVNDGTAGTKSAAFPAGLDRILPRQVVDTITLDGEVPDIQLTVDPAAAAESLKALNPARIAAGKSFSIGRVEWKPDSMLMRTYILTDAIPKGKRLRYRSVYWRPDALLPRTLADTIDYDGGGPKIAVRLDTKSGVAAVQGLTPAVIGLERTYKLSHGWCVRVNIKNEKNQ